MQNAFQQNKKLNGTLLLNTISIQLINHNFKTKTSMHIFSFIYS